MRTRTAILAFVLAIAAPSAAFASDPCSCGLGIEPLGFDPQKVPTNVKIFIPAYIARANVSLAQGAGEAPVPVPFHFEEAEGGTGDGWMVPDAPLQPNAEYQFLRNGGGKPFTTGPGEDTAPPTYASAAAEGLAIGGACEEHLSAYVNFSGAADDTTPAVSLIWQVTLKSPARTVYLSPINAAYFGRMLTDDPGWAGCVSSIPEAEEDKTYEATIVAFDWAGNASAPATNSFQFEHGGSSGCGCAVAGQEAPGGAALAAFGAALAFFRSRRRKT